MMVFQREPTQACHHFNHISEIDAVSLGRTELIVRVIKNLHARKFSGSVPTGHSQDSFDVSPIQDQDVDVTGNARVLDAVEKINKAFGILQTDCQYFRIPLHLILMPTCEGRFKSIVAPTACAPQMPVNNATPGQSRQLSVRHEWSDETHCN